MRIARGVWEATLGISLGLAALWVRREAAAQSTSGRRGDGLTRRAETRPATAGRPSRAALAQPKPQDEELPCESTRSTSWTTRCTPRSTRRRTWFTATAPSCFTTRRPRRSRLWFHLYLNALRVERSIFLRAPVASGRGTTPVDDWGYIDVRKVVAREMGGVDLWRGADLRPPAIPTTNRHPRPLAPPARPRRDVDPRRVVGCQAPEHHRADRLRGGL